MSLATRLLSANPGAQVTTALTGSLTTPGAKGAFQEGNYESIQSFVLTDNSTSTIDFTSIPSTYKSLRLVVNYLTYNATAGGTVMITRFNSDSGNNYANMQGYASAISSSSVSNLSASANNAGISEFYSGAGYMGYGTNDTTYGFAVSIMELPNYADTNWYKMVFARQYRNRNSGASGPEARVNHLSSSWRDTTAINRITITTQDGSVSRNFASGSTFCLYGIG